MEDSVKQSKKINDMANAILEFFDEEMNNIDVTITLAFATSQVLVAQFALAKKDNNAFEYEMFKNGLKAQYITMLNDFMEKAEKRMNEAFENGEL